MRDTMLIFHFLGLAMGLGTSFAHAFLGIAAARMTPDEALRFRVHSLVLARMGNLGLLFLIVSGGYLITPYWKLLGEMPFLVAKLVLVAILITLIGFINLLVRKAMQGDPETQLTKMATICKMTMIAALGIVVCAVLAFH